MKKILAIGFILASITFASCKKTETKPEPVAQTPTTPTVQYATVDVLFFVDANSYEIKEPFDYPNGSSSISKSFTVLGTQSICTATGTKLGLKYKNQNISDTTRCDLYFYKNSTYVGTCKLAILKTGKSILTQAVPISTHMDSSCVIRAVVFN